MSRVSLASRAERLSAAARPPPDRPLTRPRLKLENQRFEGTGGISVGNRPYGFLPAFRDSRTGHVYLSRFADGRLAPLHLLHSLPANLACKTNAAGHVVAVHSSVTAGFVHEDRFYTREQAANAVTSIGYRA